MLVVGNDSNQGTQGYNGKLANLLVYQAPLGMAAQNIVFNNLAARYGIGLSGSSPAYNLYGGAATGYAFNVIGIGYNRPTDLVTSSPGSGKSNGLVLSQLLSTPSTRRANTCWRATRT